MTAIDGPHNEPAPVQAMPLPPVDMVFQDWEGIIVDGEFLVRDTALAKKLGFKKPSMIRQLIKRNRAEIESYGPIPQRVDMVDIGSGARREVMAVVRNGVGPLIRVRSRRHRCGE
jgi:hypothetical protein